MHRVTGTSLFRVILPITSWAAFCSHIRLTSPGNDMQRVGTSRDMTYLLLRGIELLKATISSCLSTPQCCYKRDSDENVWWEPKSKIGDWVFVDCPHSATISSKAADEMPSCGYQKWLHRASGPYRAVIVQTNTGTKERGGILNNVSIDFLRLSATPQQLTDSPHESTRDDAYYTSTKREPTAMNRWSRRERRD